MLSFEFNLIKLLSLFLALVLALFFSFGVFIKPDLILLNFGMHFNILIYFYIGDHDSFLMTLINKSKKLNEINKTDWITQINPIL